MWDLNRTKGSPDEILHTAQVLVNDQEPIMIDSIRNWRHEHVPQSPFSTLTNMYERVELDNFFIDEQDKEKWEKEKHKFVAPIDHFLKITDELTFASQLMFTGQYKPIIVHSELNSLDVEEVSKEFIPVYVFWHGLISRDWYRHWKYNNDCKPSIARANSDKRFLLYARAWTGTRKYRLRFVEHIINKELHSNFRYNFFELDDGEYYGEYTDIDIASYFPQNDIDLDYPDNIFIQQIIQGHLGDNEKPELARKEEISSSSSAYINPDDYTQTAIQIVAETLFDTEKVHLTEKTFQPIVAGQPFLTLSAPGTLQTLKHYGFKTFDHVWDETYDSEQDHDKRMAMVIEQIEQLNNLSELEFTKLYEKCLAVCEHNRQHFFSDQFEQQMLTEYDNNFKRAFEQQQEYAKQDPGGSRYWIADKICFECYNTDFFYNIDANYLRYMLARAKQENLENYQAILEQYWWAKKLVTV
ncbi:hypothetical protein N8Z09_02760 [Methylophilaceae bacterium]|nr:hypothetical protein [Methylophilaceae bacterium]